MTVHTTAATTTTQEQPDDKTGNESTRLLQQTPATRRGSDEYYSRSDHGERCDERQTTAALSISQSKETENSPTPEKTQDTRPSERFSERFSERTRERSSERSSERTSEHSSKCSSKRLSRRIVYHRTLRLGKADTRPTFESPLVTPTADIIIRARQSAQDTCHSKYGFACDPDLSTHTNLMQTLQACLHDRISVDSAPRNHKVHNLC
jgi:hypothetical protein